MTRKLLKKRLKIIATKKLKTISNQKSSLGQWALRQLFFIQNNKLSIFFPGKLKNHINSLVTSSSSAKRIISSQLTGSTLFQSHGEPKSPKFGSNPEESLNKFRATAATTTAAPPRLPQPRKSHLFWEKYPLRLISASGSRDQKRNSGSPMAQKAVRNNWKNIYSLDQLMSHQFDSQLRLRCSPHKKRLLELQKLSALYGKLSKKQHKRLFKGNTSSNLSTNIHHIPRILEMRLDAAVKQCFAFKTFSAARHWISQERVLVNGRPISSPNHGLSEGDLVSIASTSNERYKKQLLQLYYSQPREKKHCASGQLMQRWKEWAGLYGRLQHLHPLADNPNPLFAHKIPNPVGSGYPGLGGRGNKIMLYGGNINNKGGFPASSSGLGKKLATPPDRNIQSYWYASGRFVLYCFLQLTCYCNNAQYFPQYRPCGRRLTQWLKKHPWPSIRINPRGGFSQGRFRPYRFYFNNWRAISRRKMFVFGQWLVNCLPLISDGLYHCRWPQPFIRKKSYACHLRYKHISLQKPLHFEICHKKQCAVLLYPPQKLLWPYMIDLKKLRP